MGLRIFLHNEEGMKMVRYKLPKSEVELDIDIPDFSGRETEVRVCFLEDIPSRFLHELINRLREYTSGYGISGRKKLTLTIGKSPKEAVEILKDVLNGVDDELCEIKNRGKHAIAEVLGKSEQEIEEDFKLGVEIPTVSEILREEEFNNEEILGKVLSLHPKEFEHLVAELFRRMGYVTRETRYVADGGADVYASFRDPVGFKYEIVIQCKRFNPNGEKIGISKVRELAGVITAKKADRGLLVTTGNFVKGLKSEVKAEWNNMQLWDGDMFLKAAQWLKS
jgi:HJR/Mrr/RecB family endonuclease